MEEILNFMEQREIQLLKIKKDKEKSLLKAPEGYLRVCSSNGKVQYYYRNDPKDFNGVYMNEKERKLAEKLAQKDYDQKVLKAVEKELQAIKKYREKYPAKNAEEIFGILHEGRKKLIKPIKPTTEQYVQNWESYEYKGKHFFEDTPEFYTAKGERVRSKSEVIIADTLHREGIPYRYECPVYFEKIGNIYPDFTVLNKRTRKEMYWEHFGIMDEPVYAENMVRKLNTYAQSGMFSGKNLIATYESKNIPLNQKMVLLMIHQYLK